jgi:hypothetical protein
VDAVGSAWQALAAPVQPGDKARIVDGKATEPGRWRPRVGAVFPNGFEEIVHAHDAGLCIFNPTSARGLFLFSNHPSA